MIVLHQGLDQATQKNYIPVPLKIADVWRSGSSSGTQAQNRGKCVKQGKVEHRKLLLMHGRYRYVIRVIYILNKPVQVIAT